MRRELRHFRCQRPAHTLGDGGKGVSDELRAFVRGLNMEFIDNRPLEVGAVTRHPDGRTVKIMSGCYLDDTYGRVSNFWYWREVLDSGHLGKEEHGYGWPMESPQT